MFDMELNRIRNPRLIKGEAIPLTDIPIVSKGDSLRIVSQAAPPTSTSLTGEQQPLQAYPVPIIIILTTLSLAR